MASTMSQVIGDDGLEWSASSGSGERGLTLDFESQVSNQIILDLS